MSDNAETKQQPAQENPFHEEIGEAWKSHRKGFQDKAIEQFREVLNQDPNNIDALYGLALAKKAAGNTVEARQIFEQLGGILNKLADEEHSEGRQERLFMLRAMVSRMLKQLEDQ